ncbi:hypothetical protein PanWU01x14_317580, partial [Parasponia andersonii]
MDSTRRALEIRDHSNIITEFQTRILYLEAHSRPEVYISFTGHKIPVWFHHQNYDGCLINVNLPGPNHHGTTKFMGFASCVVASKKNDKETYNPLFYNYLLKCDVCIKTSEGDERHLKFEEYINAFGKPPISTHMFMWHFDDGDNDLLSSAKEVSFDFASVKKDQYGLDFEVKKCRIHMLILQDAVDFDIISKEPSGLEIDKPCRKRINFPVFLDKITWLSSTIWMKLSKFHGFTLGGLSLFAATNLSTSEFEVFFAAAVGVYGMQETNLFSRTIFVTPLCVLECVIQVLANYHKVKRVHSQVSGSLSSDKRQ